MCSNAESGDEELKKCIEEKKRGIVLMLATSRFS